MIYCIVSVQYSMGPVSAACIAWGFHSSIRSTVYSINLKFHVTILYEGFRINIPVIVSLDFATVLWCNHNVSVTIFFSESHSSAESQITHYSVIYSCPQSTDPNGYGKPNSPAWEDDENRRSCRRDNRGGDTVGSHFLPEEKKEVLSEEAKRFGASQAEGSAREKWVEMGIKGSGQQAWYLFFKFIVIYVCKSSKLKDRLYCRATCDGLVSATVLYLSETIQHCIWDLWRLSIKMLKHKLRV